MIDTIVDSEGVTWYVKDGVLKEAEALVWHVMPYEPVHLRKPDPLDNLALYMVGWGSCQPKERNT